jgi:hypothetical protein
MGRFCRQCRGTKSVIPDVHTDFTKESGPSVLPHVLGGSHLRPAQRKAQKALLDETMGGEIRKNGCISVGFPRVFFASVPSLSCQMIFCTMLNSKKSRFLVLREVPLLLPQCVAIR